MTTEVLGISLKVLEKLSELDLKDVLTKDEYSVVEGSTKDLVELTLLLAAQESGTEEYNKILNEIGIVKITLDSYEGIKKTHTYLKITDILGEVLKLAARAAFLVL